MRKILEERFGRNNIEEIPGGEGDFPLLLISLDKSRGKILMTDGLRNYRMPVPEKEAGREYCELYFYLPSYWDIKDVSNPGSNWVFLWIRKLAKHLLEKQTWFGHGHTLFCGKDTNELSPTMKQNHFFIVNPIDLESELEPVSDQGHTVYFLAIVPIFADEMDFKQGKGTLKFIRKLITKGVSEKLDDFRSSSLKSKWRLRR